jgi:hypothetical protein
MMLALAYCESIFSGQMPQFTSPMLYGAEEEHAQARLPYDVLLVDVFDAGDALVDRGDPPFGLDGPY